MAVRTVIMVPGLLASHINRPAILPPFVRSIWPSPTALLSGLFDWLALPLDDQPGLPPSYAITLGGTYIGAAYGLLAGYLTLNGYPCVSTVGDWRRPLARDGAALAAQIRVLGLLGGVGLVCHSRGGLVARYAAARLAETGELAKLEAVVTLGTPHTGSMNAVLFLAGQGSLPDRLMNLGFGVLGINISTRAFRNVNQVLRSWASVYELLPDPDRSILPPAERAAIYDPATWTGVPHPPHTATLLAARDNWRALPDFPAGPRVLRVAGEFIDTARGFSRPPGPGDVGSFDWGTDGDGTVTNSSALWPEGPGILVPCAHDLLPLDPRLWPYILAHLNGAPAPDVTIGGDVLQLPDTSRW